MAWEEWDRLKASAAERGSAADTGMRLNGLPDDERPQRAGTGDLLEVAHTDLAAVGDHAYKLYNRLWPEARQAVIPGTEKAATSLTSQDFALGGALERVAERWDKQLKSLMDACAHISNHMDFSQKTHRDDDEWIRRSMSSIYELDRGFDDDYARKGAPNAVYARKDEEGGGEDGEKAG
ncbi:hypothetical protein ABZ714_27845 [Streptomyces sp. NPDC006798]|uniref:hypothetical protein n=1 Tax=Streptomyces sp. NPDC006798 TaxID=3155462 RepID=UPI0033D8BED5